MHDVTDTTNQEYLAIVDAVLDVIESGMRVNDPLLRNGTLAAPRMLEVAAALSRFRSLDISQT